MSFLGGGGAEGGNVSHDAAAFSAAGVTASTTQKRTGDYSMRILPTAGASNMRWAGWSSNGVAGFISGTPTYVTFWLYIAALPTADKTIASAEQTTTRGGSVVAELTLKTTGAMNITGGTTSSDTPTLSTGVWHRIDVYYETSATCRLRVDLGTEVTCTGSASTVTWLYFGTTASDATLDIYIDDWVQGNEPIHGNFRISCLTANGNGNYTGWTASAGNKYDCISERPEDGATYVSSGTGAGTQRYSATHIACSAPTNPVSGSIKWIRVAALLIEAASTTTLGGIGIRSAGTDSESTDVDIGTATAFTTFGWHRSTDPATSLPWTEAGVNAAEPICRRSTSDTSNIRCASMHIMVCFDDSVPVYPIMEPGARAQRYTDQFLISPPQQVVVEDPGQLHEVSFAPARPRHQAQSKFFTSESVHLIGSDRIYGNPGQAAPYEISTLMKRPKHYEKNILGPDLARVMTDLATQSPTYPIIDFVERPRHYAKDIIDTDLPQILALLYTQVPTYPIMDFNRRPRHYDKNIIDTGLPKILTLLFTQSPSYPLLDFNERPRHYDKFFSNNSARLVGQDAILRDPGQSPFNQILDFKSRPRHYDKFFSNNSFRFNLFQVPTYPITGYLSRPRRAGWIDPVHTTEIYTEPQPPIRPIEIIDFQRRPRRQEFNDIIYKLAFFIPFTPGTILSDVVLQLEQYAGTLELPSYVEAVELSVYQSSLDIPDYVGLVYIPPPDDVRSL